MESDRSIKKIMHIVGNRPQFIKLAPLYKELDKRKYKQVIVHSGQHFDSNMSEIFFDELDIPKPDVNLHISGGSHADMTARIMMALEPVVLEYDPLLIVLYGDTNTTLAAAVTIRKLNIPIVHVEAGPRTGNEKNPEEINRIIVDRVSSLLCAPDQTSLENLQKEGLEQKSFFSGDIMYDTFLNIRNRVNQQEVLKRYHLTRKSYILMTWHRQEDTSDFERMDQILSMVEKVNRQIVCPIHPRTKKMLEQFNLWDRADNISNLMLIDPVGYVEMVALLSNCLMTITDSGGLSRESFFAGVKCFFLPELHIWPDLEQSGWIRHMIQDPEKNLSIIEKQIQEEPEKNRPIFYGDGHAAMKIADKIEENFVKRGI